MNDLTKPIEVAEGLWWVGSVDTHQNLQCNPFLFIKGGRGILFDPGSALDGRIVLEKVQSLLPIECLEAIVLSHQDPDLCVAVSYFEKAGFRGVLCCHDRAALLIQYYGFKSPFYLVNHHNYSYLMSDGTAIGFIFSPYLHFPGAIMSYLPKQQALISGDLFGSITADWHLYADENYLDGMKAFHEVYMPSHEILASTMENLASYPISLICPQHGSIIKGNTQFYIDTLKQMPCGLFLEPVRKDISLVGGVRSLLDQVVVRLITIFGSEAIRKTFEGSEFTINIRKRQISKTSIAEDDLWVSFFQFIEQKRGVGYLSAISSLVELLGREYNLPIPKAFATLIASSEKEILEKDAQLKEMGEKLKTLEESLYRDPVTKLYNKEFHQAFLEKELGEVKLQAKVLASLVLSIDNLQRINIDFGSSEGDRTMQLLSEILLQYVEPHVQVCRLSGGTFSLLCTSLTKEEAIERAAVLRNQIAQEDRFIIPITVSMGIFHSDEIPSEMRLDVPQMVLLVNQTSMFRLLLARKQGGGGIVSSSNQEAGSRSAFTILLVDNPGFSRDLIKQILEKERYRVVVSDNGLAAKQLIQGTSVDLILCELLVPKLSGLTLRRDLLLQPSTGNIPFVLMSVNKQERTVKRAFDLGIAHFLSRPLALYELVGLINLLTKKGA